MVSISQKGLRRTAEILVLFFFWWAGNAIYAVDADRLLKSANDKTIAIELALCQISVGAFLSEVLKKIGKKDEIEDVENKMEPNRSHKSSRISLVAGNLNYLGTLLTNFSYATLGSTSTLVWKLSEPFSVIILKKVVLSESTTLVSVFGVFNIIVGILCFSHYGSKKSSAISVPIILANVAFPFRNILVKLDEKRQNIKKSALEAYNSLMINALILASVLTTLNTVRRGYFLDFQYIPIMLKNSIYFNVYQMSSIFLLRRIDALSHAVGNTMKRFATIFISVLITKETLDLGRAQGLAFTFIGFMIYTIDGKFSKSHPKASLKANYVAIFMSAYLLAQIVDMRRIFDLTEY